MDVQFGPNSTDEPNLLYKLQRKIKVFSTNNTLPNRGYNLVASSSKYGVVFVGSPTGNLLVYHLKDVIDKEIEPQHVTIKLPESPTHIAVSCDHELVVVTGGQVLSVYRVVEFQDQNVASKAKSFKFDLNPSISVLALQWNPCVPDTLAVAFSDGTLLVVQASSGDIKKAPSKARCICWSPKGKQLVTGNNDGTLSQYKPDLTLAKSITAPNIFEGAPAETLAIYWISTFQFAVVYKNATDNSRPVVAIVNTPKGGQPTCINYEDVCYSMGTNRPWYYYLQGLPQWNLILASSSNSMEIATLGSADGVNWLQWCQSDEARPELPLTDKKQENYPIGLCIDTCAIHQLNWGENETLPYMPLLLVVSQTGLLTIFNVINLNKTSPQLCTPPQLLTLPAAAMTSEIPSDVPQAAPTPAPTPVAAQPVAPQPVPPQPVAQPIPAKPQITPQPIQAPQATTFGTGGLFSAGQTQFGQTFSPASSQPKVEQKPKPVETKASTPLTIPQPQFGQAVQQAQQKPVARAQTQPTAEVNAAIKAEQEKVNKQKVEQELRNMLVKEVNDFQMELHNFVVKTRETQLKLQQDLDSIDSNFGFQSLDTEQLKKECALEELRVDIVQLKLELVRACAVVAEARTHAEAKDLHQWTQADPLTTKRVASVKKLAYYVQTQLEQAHKALDYKWNELAARDPQRKKGQCMIRPILEDVYQPLVKQQEILSRQQAVLRTLKNTLKECDATPMFKSTSLLRSTPFRNNKDPLSKLTKNILNMSLEPDSNKPKDSFLSPQKLDALRDMLSNHKPIKIKPVNVELTQQLATMKRNYEKSTKEKVQLPSTSTSETVTVKYEIPLKNGLQQKPVQTATFQKPEPVYNKVEQAPINVPTFTPVINAKPSIPGLGGVARNLFGDEKEPPKPVQPQQPQALKPQQPFPSFSGFAPPTSLNMTPLSKNSVLKDMLQKPAQAYQTNQEVKDDGNTFMGQKICKPFAFSTSTPLSTQAQSNASVASKPLSDMSNMSQKFTPQVFTPETKPQPKVTSDKTGEPSENEVKPIVIRKEPSTVLFGSKSSPLTSSAQNVPDVLKTSPFGTVKLEKPVPKPTDKTVETSKENSPETSEIVSQKTDEDKKETTVKPVITADAIKPAVTVSAVSSSSPSVGFEGQKSPAQTEPETKTETKVAEKSDTPIASSASSLFAAANAASSTATPIIFGSSSSTTSIFGKPSSSQPSTPTSTSITEVASTVPSTTSATSASSLFGSAASQAFAKTTQAGNAFSSAGTQGLFGNTTATTTSSTILFGTSTTPAVSSAAETKPTVFSTPTPASPSSVFGAAAANSAPTTPTTTAFGSSSPPLFATTTTTSTFQSGSLFDSSNTSTTAAPLFGTPTTTTSASVFGSTAPTLLFGSPTTTTPSVFGAAATTTQSVFGATTTKSIFGAATSAQSVFGGATTTTQSVFGSTTPTTQSSIFGSPTTQASVFGSAAPASPSSVFGATTQSSVFGTATATPQASVFGTPATTQASVFGAPQTTQASVFGQSSASSGSLFGDGNNLFASASISTTKASSPTSGGSIFGGGSTGSVFGSNNNTNVFGSKATFSQSNPTAASIFGGASSGGTAFGQNPATNFWSGGNTTGSSGFGSSGFGQQPTTQASSIFGASSGGSFSTPSAGPFGSPQSVFGSPQQQQSSPSFGGSPVFGSKPAFGQPAGFGSPPSGGTTGFGGFGGFNKSPSSGFGAPASFGSGATFGGSAFGGTSPGKVFGGGGASPGFGSPTQSNATFESLATQNTLTFGNLAQQSQAPSPTAAPAFSNAPSFTGWRG